MSQTRLNVKHMTKSKQSPDSIRGKSCLKTQDHLVCCSTEHNSFEIKVVHYYVVGGIDIKKEQNNYREIK